ncbi:hypothetical protein F5Y18DRAFT_442864 [Xylariaceae sp. FL1019]|nr:hypothetical protein F5Y18DRAFT_442864 [Xylariaceae sp. FL1019]
MSTDSRLDASPGEGVKPIFHRFPDLPTELRLSIWEEAMRSERQIVKSSVHVGRFHETADPQKGTGPFMKIDGQIYQQVPSFFFVSQEAHNAAKKYYSICGNDKGHSNLLGNPHPSDSVAKLIASPGKTWKLYPGAQRLGVALAPRETRKAPYHSSTVDAEVMTDSHGIPDAILYGCLSRSRIERDTSDILGELGLRTVLIGRASFRLLPDRQGTSTQLLEFVGRSKHNKNSLQRYLDERSNRSRRLVYDINERLIAEYISNLTDLDEKYQVNHWTFIVEEREERHSFEKLHFKGADLYYIDQLSVVSAEWWDKQKREQASEHSVTRARALVAGKIRFARILKGPTVVRQD